MSKEKFIRNASHINIGEIVKGEEINDYRKSLAAAAVSYSNESYEKYAQMILQDLINQYGIEEGKKRFKLLKQEAHEKYLELQNVIKSQEQKEDEVDISKRR